MVNTRNTILLVLVFAACGTSPAKKSATETTTAVSSGSSATSAGSSAGGSNSVALPAGGRMAMHGMVVFGAGPYFLEHIPMLSPPHDWQIIAEVSFTDAKGKPVVADFSNAGFTFNPSASFSLNDYVSGSVHEFTGTIFKGSFEKGGTAVDGLDGVLVAVKELKLVRQLPSAATQKTFTVIDAKNHYETNVIRTDDNVQRIRNTTTNTTLWCVVAPDFFEPCW
jgi:hypothetical protein